MSRVSDIYTHAFHMSLITAQFGQANRFLFIKFHSSSIKIDTRTYSCTCFSLNTRYLFMVKQIFFEHELAG